jgi:hypothetical protein
MSNASRDVASKKADRIIYLGPTVVDRDGGKVFMLKSGTIYSNGLPDDVKERVKEDGHLAKLFVPVGKIAHTMRALNDRDSDLSASKAHVAKTFSSRRAAKKAS